MSAEAFENGATHSTSSASEKKEENLKFRLRLNLFRLSNLLNSLILSYLNVKMIPFSVAYSGTEFNFLWRLTFVTCELLLRYFYWFYLSTFKLAHIYG